MSCDKCGLDVDYYNNVYWFEAKLDEIRKKRIALMLNIGSERHLLPVVANGLTVCAGSPSRGQYLEGQPRDSRYAYIKEHEIEYRKAYNLLLSSSYSLVTKCS